MNSVLVTIFVGFWVRNLSGLPLTLGEPIPSGLSVLELEEERRAEQRLKSRRYTVLMCVVFHVVCTLLFLGLQPDLIVNSLVLVYTG